jgi:hypothetical protein
MSVNFQYYGTKASDIRAKGFVSLQQFIELQMSTNCKLLFEQIALAEQSGDMQLKAEIKQNYLRAYTPCVIVGDFQDNGYTSKYPDVKGWKDYAHIEKFTGLAVLDFDHLKEFDIDAVDLKNILYKQYSCIIAIWVSPSRNGIKAVVSIPKINTVSEFQDYHAGLADEFKAIPGWDNTTKNPTLSLFQSYDPDLFYRKKYSTWKKKAKPPINPLPNNNKPIDIINRKDATVVRKKVLKIIGTGFNNITSVSGGHPLLLRLSISVGGYVSGGYLNETEALELMDYLIEQHPYLRKGVAGYQKTMRDGIKMGQLKPLYYEYIRGI